MLDIKYIAENLEEVKKALLKRVAEKDLKLEELLDVYEQSKKIRREYESKRAEQNDFNDKMSGLKKGSDEFLALIADLKVISNQVKNLDDQALELENKVKAILENIPNIPADDVPAGGKENNKVLREWGEEKKFSFDIKDHIQLGTSLKTLDFDRASKISGAQMPMYVGDGAMLEWALVNYFIQKHNKDCYTCIIPPHLLNEESAYVAGQLPKFRDDVYWTQDKQCLLPTAETALCNFYRDEILEEDDLPKKMFAYTPCYRREAGTYGSEERGLVRMHQFDKVEMFQYVKPDDSPKALEELIGRAEQICQDLGLRHRVTMLAAEDVSFGMAKTCDVEVWFPFDKVWKEVSSVSNATEFQARRGNIRFREKDSGKLKFVHTLNGSGLATSRLMIAIMETYQQEDGSIEVPAVLRDYMGKDIIKAKN
ncbi:serine--tRNA ligase [Candidatus Dojkabacteria bacterium]|nr:serine--tRNA ligase [Candidatus Dojkabacteria bacterium]